jgi:hypothetical protein
MDQSEYVQEPEHDDNNHHCVQNGLDASGHGDEAIYEPQQNTNDDQYSYKVNQGHDRFFLRTKAPGLAQDWPLLLCSSERLMRQVWSGEEPGTSEYSS